jgi:hypothetical protein
VAGVVTALWAVLASLVAARTVNALATLGAEADEDRRTAADVERRIAGRVLLEQAAAMGEARAPDITTDRLARVAKDAENYLRPAHPRSLGVLLLAACFASPVADRIDVATEGLETTLDTATERCVVDAVAGIALILASTSPHCTVRVRGASTSTDWQVTLLAETHLQHGDKPNAVIPRRLRIGLAAASVEVTARSVPGGGLRVVLRPTRGQGWQELAIDAPSRPTQG